MPDLQIPSRVHQSVSKSPITSLQAQQVLEMLASMRMETHSLGPVSPKQQTTAPHHSNTSNLFECSPVGNLVQSYFHEGDMRMFPLQHERQRGDLSLFERGEQSSNHVEASCANGIAEVVNMPLLDFADKKVWKCVQSYEDNIQNMHPLIPPLFLHAMVRSFLDEVQNEQPSHTDIGTKRKQPQSGTSEKDYFRPARPVLKPSIQNSLVLTALALGKICLWKDKIPEILPRKEIGGFVVVQSMDEPFVHDLFGIRNMEVIPGLDYFAYATHILQKQNGRYQLEYILIKVLASLYYGQLGRPVQSYDCIHDASNKLLALLMP